MGREKIKNKQALGQVYKEFSRLKYNKYRHQFPRMRQSDIINKIIKQWQRLDQDQKVKLFDEYTTRNMLKEEKSQSQGSQRNELKKKEMSSSVSRRAKSVKSKSVKVQHETISNKDQEESEKEKSIKKSVRDRQSESDRSFDAMKTKGIKKTKTSIQSLRNGEYIQFFKYYYERLSQQHPKWTSSQISTIIKLLWKKRNTKATKGRLGKKQRALGARLLTKKKISGRMAFKRSKISQGFNKEEIFGLWKKLPRQSKINWEKEGRGSYQDKKKNKLKGIMNKGKQQRADQQQTSFQLKYMKCLIPL